MLGHGSYLTSYAYLIIQNTLAVYDLDMTKL